MIVLENLEEVSAEKKKELKEISARFTRDELEEEDYLKEVRALSEEI